MPAPGQGVDVAFLELKNVEKEFGPVRVLRGINLGGERASGGLPHRPLGLWEVNSSSVASTGLRKFRWRNQVGE